MATLSSDLLWEVNRGLGGTSSTLVKRKQAGGVQFSRDQLNLRNKYSRKVCTLRIVCLGLPTLIDYSMRVW